MLKSAEEVLAQYRLAMGADLGPTYYAIVCEIVALRQKWGDYLALYGHSPERVTILNNSAATFFGRHEAILWNDILLHIARLIDAPRTSGRDNLSIQILPDLIYEKDRTSQIRALVKAAIERSIFVNSWRNIVLAHKDHDFALKSPSARELDPASREKVRGSIESIKMVMKVVHECYFDAHISFDHGYDHAGEELIAVLENVAQRRVVF